MLASKDLDELEFGIQKNKDKRIAPELVGVMIQDLRKGRESLASSESQVARLEKLRQELGAELAATQGALVTAVSLLERQAPAWEVAAALPLLQESVRGGKLGKAFLSQIESLQQLYNKTRDECNRVVLASADKLAELYQYKRAFKKIAPLVAHITQEELIAAKNAAAEIVILEQQQIEHCCNKPG